MTILGIILRMTMNFRQMVPNKKIDWGNDMKTKEEITNILTETLCYAYCDNCGNDMNEDLCGDCHRKYQNWKLSVDVAEKIADEILE